QRFGQVCIFYGARTPADILYRHELRRWRGQFDLLVDVTVDRATQDWAGRVGVVPRLVEGGGYDPQHTLALVCGPEIMMRHTARALLARGVRRERIHVSMERNMKCAVGLCGHCQFGPHFVCRDGPVFRFDVIEALMTVDGL
ncbi:MAG TPA: Ni/Fe hydrogenase subunit gamma, partial [Plasticicumulans sp.]|nr:Ni/Fe hydrogenase subunit gamma [Plasticicumulans sp.]